MTVGSVRVTVSRRLFVALSIIAVLSPPAVAASAGAIWQVRQLVHDRDADQEVDEAEACVAAWDRSEQIRRVVEDAVREGSTAGAGAVLDLARQVIEQPLPEESDLLLEEAVDRRVRVAIEETVATYPDPGCDLEAAQAVLTDQEEP